MPLTGGWMLLHKLPRTISDLAGSEGIGLHRLAEALQYMLRGIDAG